MLAPRWAKLDFIHTDSSTVVALVWEITFLSMEAMAAVSTVACCSIHSEIFFAVCLHPLRR